MKSVHRRLSAVILDDEEAVETAIKSRLPKEIGRLAKTVKPSTIASLVAELRLRIAAARKGSKARGLKDTILDGADIFVVDYDLIEAKGEDYLTGETVAYLARCYSRCGVIVALNQFYRRPTFDLTLKPQLDSFADINISADDLQNEGLWTEGPWKAYRPWHWPILTNLIRLMHCRVQDVANAEPSTPVMRFLTFPESAVERLPASSFEILAGSRAKPEFATLRDILHAPSIGLRGKEAQERKSSSPRDAPIIAARLSAWLNMILSPQDVLVDAPHLAERCPSLLGSKITAKSLDLTAQLRPDANVFRNKQLKKAKFSKNFWYDRPVWFWTEIEQKRLLPEIRDPWQSEKLDYVFCEDTSSFAKRTACKSFQSDLQSPYRTRHVKMIANVEYQPIHRLAQN
jgi:hypothetical protein